MHVVLYTTRLYEKDFLKNSNAGKHHLKFVDLSLTEETAYLAKGADAVSIFVNDDASEKVLVSLHNEGVKFLALRSAGYNHVNLVRAKELKMRAARVPAYSPYAVAEHTIALMLALNRKIIRANSRVH